MRKYLLLAAATVGLATPAFAGTIRVEDARAEMMEGTADRGDVFMTITNVGATPDRLYALRTEVAKSVILESESEDSEEEGVENEATSFLVNPGEPLVLSEEGAHVELKDLVSPLKEGQTFMVTLFFEQAGPINIEVTVEEEAE